MKKIAMFLTLAILTIGCSKNSPTDPGGNIEAQAQCAVGCDGKVKAPSASDADAAMRAARDAVREAVAREEIRGNKQPNWEALPRIEWQACFFYVGDGYWYSGGTRMSGPNCAAGMTVFDSGKIVIATQDPARVIALIKWETANYFLISIGRQDLCDQWQSGKTF